MMSPANEKSQVYGEDSLEFKRLQTGYELEMYNYVIFNNS